MISEFSFKRNPLDSIERVALSFGFSVAAFIDRYRRQERPGAERVNVILNYVMASLKGQSFVDRILSIVLVAAIVGGIGSLIYVISTPKTGEGFTEFSIMDLKGKAIDYLSELKIRETGQVILRITNLEKVEMSYRVEVRIDGTEKDEVGPIVLGDEQKWGEIVSFTPDRVGDNQKVEFLLYKNERSKPYLTLHLWVNVKE